MADIKFSEFPKANQSKDSDEIAILQDGINKMIPSPVLESKIINKTVSRVIEQGGTSLNIINLKGVVPTYADLALITPTPELNDAYQVEADGLVYVYTENGFQADGDGFAVQPEPIGVVEEGNTQAVSGDTVFKALPEINTVRSEHQLFDKVNGWEDGGFSTSNTNQSTEGSRRTKYINIPDEATAISFTGLGTSANKRIAYMSGEDGTGTFLGVNIITTSNNTIPRNLWADPDAKSFRFFYQRAEDGDVNDTFMLNFGEQMDWEPYEYIQNINGVAFLEKKPIEIYEMYAVLNGTSPTVNASGWYRATPVVDDVAMKGNTGLGYDLKRNLFIVSEYNTTVSSRLLIFRQQDLVDRNTSSPVISSPFRTIDLTEYLDHIQGCSWDFVDDTYLALGTLKGQATGSSNSVVVKVSPAGTLLDIIPLGDNLIVQVGMIDVLIDGNIIIKPNAGSTAYIFNRAYSLIDRKTLIANEGICVNKYNGDIWCASDAFVVKKYDKNFTELATYSYNTFTNESSGSNVEGMCILPDGSLVISADAYLHGATQLGNSLFFFDFEQTVNKRLYFYLPNGIGDYKNITLDYTSEMVLPSATITDLVVVSNSTLKKVYRSGTTKASVGNAAFSSSLVSNTVFQTMVSL